MVIKLFVVGYAETKKYVVAENESEAIRLAVERYKEIASLPLVADVIDNVDDKQIIAVDDEFLEEMLKVKVDLDNKNEEFEELQKKYDEAIKEIELLKKPVPAPTKKK